MFDVIVISHGDFSKAIVETAQMIVGEQEAVETVGLYLGDSVDLFRERVTEAVREHLRHNDVMVVTDMQSGSPFNVAVAAMEEHRFRHFTGMNLPMLLEIFSSRPYCSLEEIFNLFKSNRRILLFLIKNQIVTIDKYVVE